MTQRRREIIVNSVWAVLALLATAAVLFTSNAPGSAEQLSREQHLLSVFRSAEVSRVSLDKDGAHYVIARGVEQAPGAPTAEGRWQWREPFQGDAEEAAVDQWLHAAQFATWLRALPDADVDRALLGLDTPLAVVSLDMGEMHARLRIANLVAGGNGARYVEVTGEGVDKRGVFVVSESTVADLSPNQENLRIRQLIPYSATALQSIRVQSGEQTIRLVRNGRQEFRFDGAFGGARVSRDALDRILVAFARTEVALFVPMEQATQLQDAASAEVLELELEPRETAAGRARVFIGGKCPSDGKLVLARRVEPRPSAGCIARTDLALAFAVPQSLVDRSLFQARLDETERMTVVEGERRLELVRTGDAFELRAPARGAVEKDAGEQRVGQILAARGVVEAASTDLAALGLDPPAATVTIEVASAEPDGATEVVELGRPVADASKAGPRSYARRRSDGVVLLIGSATRASFGVDALLLRARQLWDMPSSEVREVRVECGEQATRLHQAPSGTLGYDVLMGNTQPDAFEPDAQLAIELLEVARQMRVERWVAEQDDGSHGFDKPRLSFWVTDAHQGVHQVVVGAATGQGYFARVDKEPGVFVLARRSIATLETLLFDRRGFMLDAEHAGAVSLRRAGRSVSLRRIGNDWEQDPGEGELSQESRAALIEALGLVRPERAVAVDPVRKEFGLGSPLLEVRFTNDEGPEQQWVIGGRGVEREQSVYYARLRDRAVVYAIAAQQIDAVLSAL